VDREIRVRFARRWAIVVVARREPEEGDMRTERRGSERLFVLP
jgi:hypothetical protein